MQTVFASAEVFFKNRRRLLDLCAPLIPSSDGTFITATLFGIHAEQRELEYAAGKFYGSGDLQL